jgi:4,4'-diaponeurosporenoate glycosyltransferase
MFGACFFISRRDYERLGGHKEVFNELIEDVVLAQKAGLLGIKVHNFAGKGVVTASLYPDGFKNVIEGWSRTFQLGARMISPFSFLLVFYG